MKEWLYRASTAQAKSAETWTIVRDFGYLHRSVYANASKAQRIPNVMNVAIDDLIHLYYVGDNGGRPLGVLRVVDPKDHPRGDQFGAVVPETHLWTVVGPDLLARLPGVGYERDPKLGEYCGWPVVRAEGRSPPYAATLFTGHNSLVPLAPTP